MKTHTSLFGSTLLTAGLFLLICLSMSGCEQVPTPEERLRKWLGHMQNGECESATRMIVESSKEPIELDCAAYEGEIISIACETTEESASCDCIESRNGVEGEYEYDLKMVDGEWKLAGGFVTL